MTGRSDQEDHAGWAGARVGERVRATARDIHDTPRSTPGDLVTVVRFPVLPVSRGSDTRLESKQVKLAVENVEQLLRVAVQMSTNIKAWCNVDDFEHRPESGVFVAHLERHRGRNSFTLARR